MTIPTRARAIAHVELDLPDRITLDTFYQQTQRKLQRAIHTYPERDVQNVTITDISVMIPQPNARSGYEPPIFTITASGASLEDIDTALSYAYYGRVNDSLFGNNQLHMIN